MQTDYLHTLNQQLYDTITTRPSRMTEVLRLRAGGMTYQQIAEQTGLTKNNVAQYLHRAKQLYGSK